MNFQSRSDNSYKQNRKKTRWKNNLAPVIVAGALLYTYAFRLSASLIKSTALSARNSGILRTFPSNDRFISENLNMIGVCSWYCPQMRWSLSENAFWAVPHLTYRFWTPSGHHMQTTEVRLADTECLTNQVGIVEPVKGVFILPRPCAVLYRDVQELLVFPCKLRRKRIPYKLYLRYVSRFGVLCRMTLLYWKAHGRFPWCPDLPSIQEQAPAFRQPQNTFRSSESACRQYPCFLLRDAHNHRVSTVRNADFTLFLLWSPLKTSFTADFYDLPRNVATLLIHHLRRYQTLKYIQ